MRIFLKTFSFKFVRSLFGLYIIYLALFQIQHLDILAKSVPKTIETLNSQVLAPREITVNLSSFTTNAKEIVQFYLINLVISGLFILFGFKIGKYFLTISVLIDLIFIHNWANYEGQVDHVSNTSKLVSILGGSFYL